MVDKPPGPTSHDIVGRVKRLTGSKTGHAGTLDPTATGVLILGIGRATRLLAFLQGLPKTYRAGIRFGTITTTGDSEGDVVEARKCSFTRSHLESAITALTGEIEQLPPMYSAVKVSGRPLYKSARRGEEVERAPRRVTVYQFDLEEADLQGSAATVFVRCSSGTFIRTLATDLGEVLGCGAHLHQLRRLSVGSFSESEAVQMDELERWTAEEIESRLIPMGAALRDFPEMIVEGARLEDVRHGRPLQMEESPVRSGELPAMAAPRSGDRPAHEAGMTAGVPVAILSKDGDLLAVYRRSRSGLKPAAVLQPMGS